MDNHIITIDSLDAKITLEQTDSFLFRVTYGLQVSNDLTYLQAAEKFGNCVMHSACCCGYIEDELT